MRTRWCAIGIGVALGATALGARAPQPPRRELVWAPKLAALAKYVPPQRPWVRLSDLRARHRQDVHWRERLVDDGHLRAEYVQLGPGESISRRFHPDTRVWWAVVDGTMRVEIEGQEPFLATRGSLVQVPKQTIYSMATVGDRPSLYFVVNVAGAKTLYPEDVTPEPMPGFEYAGYEMSRRPAPYDAFNKPHLNLYQAAKAPGYRGGRFVRDDKSEMLVIYGRETDLPPLSPNDKGHFHPESAEFWLVLTGKIRYALEGQAPFVAEEGDVVYVPASTWHLARFAGGGVPSCRLSITDFVGNSILLESRPGR